MIQSKINLILKLFFIFCLASCSKPKSDTDPIAMVNGSVITAREFLNMYETLKPREISPSPAEKQKIKSLVLKTLVRRYVVLTEATKLNITVSDDEVDSGLKSFRSDYTQPYFKESLLESMVDEDQWKSLIKQSLLIQKLFSKTKINVKKPSMAELLAYYQDNASRFKKPATATALQIVVNDESLIKEIRTKLLASPSQFLSLAAKHSVGPEAKEDAKITIQKGMLPPELDTPLFELPLNTLSPIIQSAYGYHLLKVERRTKEVNQDFEAVSGEISRLLTEQNKGEALQAFEEDLIRAATIEYNRELFKSL